MAQKKVSIITLRLTEEEAQELETFKKMVGKKNGSTAIKYMIHEYPRWQQIIKETFSESREIKKKYEELKEVNKLFLIALGRMKKHIDGDN